MKLPESGEFCWNELACRDVKKSERFLRKDVWVDLYRSSNGRFNLYRL